MVHFSGSAAKVNKAQSHTISHICLKTGFAAHRSAAIDLGVITINRNATALVGSSEEGGTIFHNTKRTVAVLVSINTSHVWIHPDIVLRKTTVVCGIVRLQLRSIDTHCNAGEGVRKWMLPSGTDSRPKYRSIIFVNINTFAVPAVNRFIPVLVHIINDWPNEGAVSP